MKTSLKLMMLTAAVIAGTATIASANVVDLTFSGVATYPTENYPSILNFYNGGTDSAGMSGPNFGIYFSDNALGICLNTLAGDCSNTSKGGLGDPNSQEWGLFWLSNTDAYLDDPGGFTTGFSFDYTAINVPGSINVYSGLDGTGTLLASLALPTTPSGPCPGYDAGFCPFYPIGVAFAGTAESIDFGGTANQIVFDDVTFGSVTPGPPTSTPEPSSLLLLGTGIAGLAGMIRRKLARAL
jgi:hypothetical protein